MAEMSAGVEGEEGVCSTDVGDCELVDFDRDGPGATDDADGEGQGTLTGEVDKDGLGTLATDDVEGCSIEAASMGVVGAAETT